MTDILVVGGGPAGLAAALYAARAGKSVLLLEREVFGGQITQAPLVENYPGLDGISGLELGDRLSLQAEKAGAQIALNEVHGISRCADGSFLLDTDDGSISGWTVIYAAGAKPRTMGLTEESVLVGHGISYCALCDGAFFDGQDVAVAGGGNTAFSDALYLSERCRSVTVIHRRKEFRADRTLVRRVEQTSNIKLLTDAVVIGLDTVNRQLTGLVLNAAQGRTTRLSVTGLFVALGRIPDTGVLVPITGCGPDGYILTTEQMKTSVPGLFAAGDCRCKRVRQLTTAVSDGTIAAVSTCKYLTER